MSQGREYTPEYKAQIVVEVLREVKTVSEIAARENVSPKVIYNWRREFMENAYRAFSVTKDEKALREAMRAAESREKELLAKIGQLTYESDWLKKKYEGIYADGKGRNARGR
jgi:transposase-like protein